MKIIRFVFTYIQFFMLVVIYAQQSRLRFVNNSYNIHVYTSNDGLSQVSINDIVQDKNGFLWVATQDGLNRFNGTSFLTFRHESNTSKNQLSGNFINHLLVDDNLIWIGTRSGGLCYYDINNHLFHHLKSLPVRDILDIEKDASNHIYVSLEDIGIAIISKKRNGYKTQIMSYFTQKNVSVSEIYIIANEIWVGTKKGRLFYGKLKNNPSNTDFVEMTLPKKTGSFYVIKAVDNYIYAGTSGQLLQIDRHTKKVKSIQPANIPTPIVYDLTWHNNHLWFTTEEGIVQYDPINKQIIQRYSHNDSNPNSLSNNTVNKLFFDTHDQLWVGTGKYLNLFYRNPVFHSIQSHPFQKNTLNSNIIFALANDERDTWIGTAGGGINLIRNNNFYSFTKQSHHLPSNTCFSLVKQGNHLWAGTREGLVIMSNTNDDYWKITTTNILHKPDNPESLSNNFVRYIYKDDRQNIWLCTSEGGLERFTGDLTKKIYRFEHYRHDNRNANNIISNKIYYITQTDNHTYWIGTDKGLDILSFENEHWNQPAFSQLQLDGKTVLNNCVVYTLLKDHHSDIWIGTNIGLFYYSISKNKLSHYDTNNGLPNNVIYGILQDAKKNIWLSTNKGLSCLSPKTKEFTNYHKADGLSSEEYNLHAKYINKNGVLFFGGINGITYFDPDKIGQLSEKSRLYINNIQLTDRKSNKIKVIHPDDHILNIKSGQLPFYVNFSDINLNYYKNTGFAYHLSPGNGHWNFIQDKRQIQFINLSPGEYHLKIQGVTRGKIWKNTRPLQLAINIIPLWWQSGWAYFVYALLFLSLIYFFYRFTINKKLEHQENLRLIELDEMKTKLYGNITHELRTPLTVIMGVTENIKNLLEPEQTNKIGNKLNAVTRSSKKLLFLINQILDLNKIESNKMQLMTIQTDIIPFFKVILDSFHSLSQYKNIDLLYYNEIDELLMDFDPDKISIIVSNLLSNAIKFTPENGKIILHINKIVYREQTYLSIKIKDDGIGISEEHQKHIFDRFYQVNTMNPSGTGIGLSLTKELVTLMKGEISVKSKLHQGTEFRIQIPITHQAEIFDVLPAHTVLLEEERKENDEKGNKDNKHELEYAPQLLLIEDNKDVAQFIASGLINQYEIIFAKDGKEGIEKAQEHIPDLIITDIMMPIADGFEVCNVLKNDKRTSHIPIIVLTARTMEKDKVKSLAYGADAYITKPFNVHELRIRIEQLILLRKRMQEKYKNTGFIISKGTSKETEFINICIHHIQNHLDDDNYKTSRLAFDVHLSESQLYRKIKAITNLSTAVFIRETRLTFAKEMLEKTNLNISEIAYKCGFANPDWFSKSFKEKFNFSPSDFRKKT